MSDLPTKRSIKDSFNMIADIEKAVQLTGKTHLGITVDPKLKSQADAQVQHVLDRISKLRDLIKQCETNVLSPEEQAARSKEIDAIMEILKHKAGS